MADEFSLDFDKIAVEQSGGWAGGTLDWIQAFGRSALESIPELVGITPSDETVRWRSSNPWSGVASELAGMAVPYGGWFKAARGIKALEAVATGTRAADVGTDIGKAAYQAKLLESPFLTAARAEAVRFAPFEVGRVLANEAIGDKSLGEMAVSAGLNLGLGAGAAGGLAKLGAMGKVAPPLREVVPGLDEGLPGQLILRQLDNLLPQMPELSTRIPDIELRLRGEVAPLGTRHVDPKLDVKGDLEALFKPGVQDAARTEKKRLLTGTAADTFARDDDWMDIVRAAGVEPQEVPRLMQFPRVITFNTEKEMAAEVALGLGGTPSLKQTTAAALRTEKALFDRLSPVGDGWLAGREADNGMYVMARKVAGDMPGEKPSKPLLKIRYNEGRKRNQYASAYSEQGFAEWMARHPKAKVTSAEWTQTRGGLKHSASPDDQWLLFKTDQPGRFVKNSQGFMNTQVARDKWIVGTNALEKYSKDTGLVGESLQLQALTPWDKFSEIAAAAGDPGKLAKWTKDHLPKALKGNAATQHGSNFVRTFLAPADAQMRKSVRGAWVMNQARLINTSVDTWYQKALQGELKFKGDRAVFSKIVPHLDTAGKRPIETILEDFDKEGLVDGLMRLQREGISLDGAAQLVAEGKLRPRAVELAAELRAWREAEHAEFNKSLELIGEKPQGLKDGDYGLPREWTGDFMQVVRNEGGAIVGVAAGGSAAAAKRQAEALAAQLSRETARSHRLGEAFTRTQDMTNMPSDVRLFARNPGGMLQNKNIRGFKWDLDTPTKNDLLDAYNQAFSGRGRVLATNLRDASLRQHVAALEVDDPASAKLVVKRFNQMAGQESEFGKIQNKVVDSFLGPVFGANNATRIVQYTNTGMVHLQLGAFKLSYPLQNIVGVVQTVMPQIAFVMNAGADAVTQAYGMTVPAVGTKGAVGSLSTLAPMKIMGQALRMVMKPTKEEREAFEWALNNRVLGAQVGEEYIGQNRRTLAGWKGALTSPRAFGDFALALSEWLPVHSERFARTLSFAAGYRVFRDWARITDEDVLRLQAKRFTERTNFMYASADRPLAFTTPIGSSLGLFKTWQMNFIYQMADYANLGFNKNVWSPLMWQTMGTAAVGGAAATPLYWVADGASKFFQDKSLVQYAYDEYGDNADAIMFGLPAALTGVSLSGLMTSPGANPVKDATQLFSFAMWQRMRDAGGAVGAAMDNWKATGAHPGSDPDVRNALIKALSPVLVQRAMALDWGEGTTENIVTGLKSTKGLSFYDMMMYQAGLNPAMIERQMFASDQLYHDKIKMQSATRAFGDALAEAWESGDSEGANVIIQRAIGMGVAVDSIMRSATARGRQAEKTSAERQARPEVLSRMQNVIGQ